MPKVLVIDDDEALFALIKEFCQQTEFELERAGDGEIGLARLLAEPGIWDAVILDVMLPSMDGMEVLSRLRDRAATRDLPILMLTARGDENDRVAGLEAGADDYLAKPFSLRELVARLRATLRRSQSAAEPSADVIRVDNLVIDRGALQISGGASVRLTPLELRLLEVLVEKPGLVIGREELYQRVFDHEAYHYDRSLDMAVSRLRKKLGPRSDGGERIRAAWGEGYVFLLPEATA